MIIRNLTHIKTLGLISTTACYSTFNGVNELIDLGTATDIVLPTTFTEATWSIWVRHTGITQLYWRCYDGGNTLGTLFNTSVGPQMFLANIGGAGVHTSRSVNFPAFSDGNWHNILSIYNGAGSLNVYADGVLANGSLFGSIPASITMASTLNHIGSSTSEQNVSQFAVWDRALTSIEITEVYNRGRYVGQLSDIPNLTYQLRLDTLNPVDVVGGKPATSDNMNLTNIICE